MHALVCAVQRGSNPAPQQQQQQQQRLKASSTAASAATAAAAAALCLVLAGPGAVAAAEVVGDDFSLPYAKPEVTTDSSPRALALAARLRDAGAHMYGAFWCSHCFEVEQLFGRQAMAAFPYEECFPTGWNRAVKLAPACAAVPVRAFPTWTIGDRVIEGELDFDAIESTLDEVAAAAATAAP
ncbi:thiol-disulfide oxidoreductase-like [Raphidocelis subcapitata]|uniref:Thiol-disulfide oxidoreductase-like n=1 Tax=Raphidocelis subcapitata TaxID=307507 RepID=A0A2V0NYV4_9CHLO|nr:thiol-disulfide oxidoreductase-like [Raphidocelis subcapitata]|eukprot:GBF90107.1 thiol-disulfide oxidoreductase-like [Raphidocelis subcapitata]